MITDPEQHRRPAEADRWEALARMTPEESIGLGEALLTSELMDLAEFPDDDRPVCLPVSLGLTPRYGDRPG